MLSFNRISALIIKEFKDLKYNKNVMVMFVMPVGFSILYKEIMAINGNNNVQIINVFLTCLGMSLIMGSGNAIGMIIAEEKEKKTLRTMLLCGLKPMEFFLGKLIVTLLLTSLVNLIIFTYFNMPFMYYPLYFLITLIMTVLISLFGAIIGMIAPNQMATGVVGLPLFILFLLIPMFASLNEFLVSIAKYMPTYGMNQMLNSLLNGNNPLQIARHGFDMGIIGGWILISIMSFSFVYTKFGLEK